ncbi:cysteine protease ATG4A-like [Convolutriloba macropyga]|uniref:cysteine protease ATG4A-like n=1 Tax=Convolutriloba macropyga TaxID=536237 RepID=UPI003F51AD0F
MAIAPQHFVRRNFQYLPDSPSVSPSPDDLEWLGPVWVLGKFHNGSSPEGRRYLKKDIVSRLLMTYRKGFSAIGGTELTSDRGWGCMLRCGQMMLAQTLLCLWVGRDWLWQNSNSEHEKIYQKILEQFLDYKNSLYSVHQIAQMGVSEGKSVGEWFGPNTVAQVLKKLSMFDEFTPYCVHVAMDNTIVIDDVYALCKALPFRYAQNQKEATNVDDGTPSSELDPEVVQSGTRSYSSGSSNSNRSSGENSKNRENHCLNSWRPILLIVPLRLGLTDINSSYIDPIKECFHMEETMGIIGGRPNSAYYFIGYQGSFLLYLDPHDTRPTVATVTDDSSYHCDTAKRMPFTALDPSLAIGFLLQSQAQFDTWCSKLRESVITDKKQPLFEIVQKRPAHWPPLEIYPSLSSTQDTLEDMAATFLEISSREMDDDFVVI